MRTTHLRKYRKSAQLTQREVAHLVGYTSQRAYSDVELGVKRPALGTAFACCIVFKAKLEELFPSLAEAVERGVGLRARDLHESLKTNRDREAAALHLADVVERIDGSDRTE